MTEEKRPLKEANRLTRFLDMGLSESERFPVNIKKVALELTPSFNSDPITTVQGNSMGKIEGMLAKHPTKDEWGIFYNSDIEHQGRQNFTLAHELGHYMVHRQNRASARFECGETDMLDKDQQVIDIEAEANAFAACLLMPAHDFRKQESNQRFCFDLMSHCADRYGVSLTAAILRWLEFTNKRAIALLSEEGFMHWSKSSNSAYKSGKYFATKKNCLEIPSTSAAATERYDSNARGGLKHGSGVWFSDEEVIEHSIYSEEHGKTLTVLILSDVTPYTIQNKDSGEEPLLSEIY